MGGGGEREERKIFEEIILCVLGYRRALFLSVSIRIFFFVKSHWQQTLIF